jgi:hypothetical protein
VRESCFNTLKLIKENKSERGTKISKNDSFKNTSFLSEDQEKYYDFLDYKERSKSSYLDNNNNKNKIYMSLESFQKLKQKKNMKKGEAKEIKKKILNTETIKNVRSESTLKRFNTKSYEFSKPNSNKKLTSRDNSQKKRIISIFKGPKNKEFFEKIPNGVEIVTRYEETDYQKTKEIDTDLNKEVTETMKRGKRKIQSGESSIVEHNFINKENNMSPFSVNTENIPKEENGNCINPNTINEIIKQLKFISEV